MHWVGILLLHGCKLPFVGVLAFRVFAVADLVIFEDALNVALHESREVWVMHSADRPSVHLIQVQRFQVNFIFLIVPLFRKGDG